jgi:hypothetical protein
MSAEQISFVVLSQDGDPLVAHVLVRIRKMSEESRRLEGFSDEQGRVTFLVPDDRNIEEIIVGAKDPGFWVIRLRALTPSKNFVCRGCLLRGDPAGGSSA